MAMAHKYAAPDLSICPALLTLAARVVEPVLFALLSAVVADDVVLELVPVVLVEVSPAARDLYFSKVLPDVAAGALITMAIPDFQWFPCEQYSHNGSVLLIEIVYVGNTVAFTGTGMNPEYSPSAILAFRDPVRIHGCANVLWTTE